jgi:hypothetical protein
MHIRPPRSSSSNASVDTDVPSISRSSKRDQGNTISNFPDTEVPLSLIEDEAGSTSISDISSSLVEEARSCGIELYHGGEVRTHKVVNDEGYTLMNGPGKHRKQLLSFHYANSQK